MLRNLLFGPPATGSTPGGRPYLPGLDGLRALSVIAVLIFHARPEWLPGGFLGVEVFFVISGFIITRALLHEWNDNGRIALGRFWLRRARRLLPAVGLLLAGVGGYVAIAEPDEMLRLRGDVLAALAYVTNWHLIVGEQSYFESFQRPSMLQHLWSLAVEEQFYIVWPLILAVGLRFLKKPGVALLIVAGIAASAIGMALLYNATGDNARAYFGTDTRAAGLLVGALLAFIVVAREGYTLGPVSKFALPVLGIATLAGLVAATFWLHDGRAFLYQGGFLAVSVTSALLIVAATSPNVFATMLSLRPLRWVGVRSYGIYLWHWPIYMLVWPREATLTEVATHIAAVVVIAAISYILIEKPVREGFLGRAWQGFQAWSAHPWQLRGAVAFSGVSTAAVALGLLAASMVLARPPEVPEYFRTGSIQIRSAMVAQDVGSVMRVPTLMGHVQTTISTLTFDRPCASDNLSPGGVPVGVVSSPFGSTCPQPVALFERPDTAVAEGTVFYPESALPTSEEIEESFASLDWTILVPETPSPPVEPPADSAPPAMADPNSATPPASAGPPPAFVARVTAIGDSVMLGAAYAMAASIPGIDLDAAVGRQADSATALIQQKAAAGQLGDVVVLHIGNNGTLTAGQFDQMMAAIGPERRVIVLNLHVPRQWQDSNNAVIVGGVGRYGNAILIDWYSAGITYPGILYSDGIHLTPAGADYYTQLVLSVIGS